MNKAKNSFYFLAAMLIYITGYSQTPDKIRIRKLDSDFYFFQVGTASDTIGFNKNDIFYMKISANNGCRTRIEIENGQLLKAGNDSTFRLKHLVNLNYLHQFTDTAIVEEEKMQGATVSRKKTISKCAIYKVMINGMNTSSNPNLIIIRFINTENEKVILENSFYYK